MTALQQISLGTAPAGADGDTVRSAFNKLNGNATVLGTQAALVSQATLVNARALTKSDTGTRVSFSFTAAKSVALPPASTCTADSVILLRNLGAYTVTLTPASGTSDTLAVTRLNPGETVLLDTDGAKAWGCLVRGRALIDDEVINGALTVGGALVAAGKAIGGINGANLLLNGSGEFGNVGWQGTVFGSALDAYHVNVPYFGNAAGITAGGSYGDVSPMLPATAGDTYTFSGEVYTKDATQGDARIYMRFFDASGTKLGGDISSDKFRYLPYGSDYVPVSCTGTAPADTASMYVGKGAFGNPLAPPGGFRFRRLKLELGSTPSPYSQEASLAWLQASPAFSGRPTFAGKTPWDSGNLNVNAIPGITSGTAPAKGTIGEFLSATASGSVSNGGVADIATLALSAGIWDVQGILLVPGKDTITVTGASATVGTTSATVGDITSVAQWSGSTTGANRLVTPVKRLVLSAATTLYLVANVYASGAVTAQGLVTARRVA